MASRGLLSPHSDMCFNARVSEHFRRSTESSRRLPGHPSLGTGFYTMSTYVIGDVHGRYRQLQQLERDVPWDLAVDKVVFLGDLNDRGDQIMEVVDEVISLREANPNVVALRGNHEQMLLDCLDYGDLSWLIPENGGQETISQYGCPLHTLHELEDIKIPAPHVKFFRSMPLFHEDELA